MHEFSGGFKMLFVHAKLLARELKIDLSSLMHARGFHEFSCLRFSLRFASQTKVEESFEYEIF